jgi:hypothetical protein
MRTRYVKIPEKHYLKYLEDLKLIDEINKQADSEHLVTNVINIYNLKHYIKGLQENKKFLYAVISDLKLELEEKEAQIRSLIQTNIHVETLEKEAVK